MTNLCLFTLIVLHHHFFRLRFFSFSFPLLPPVTPCSLSLSLPSSRLIFRWMYIHTDTWTWIFGFEGADQPSVTEMRLDLENKQTKTKGDLGAGEDTETQKRGDDGEEAWNVILCYQNSITRRVEKRAFSDYSGPTLFLTSQLKFRIIHHRHQRGFIIWFF